MVHSKTEIQTMVMKCVAEVWVGKHIEVGYERLTSGVKQLSSREKQQHRVLELRILAENMGWWTLLNYKSEGAKDIVVL